MRRASPRDRAHGARWHLAGYALVGAVSVVFESALAVTLWLAPMLSTKILHQVQNTAEHTGAAQVPDTLVNTRTI